MFRRLRRPRRTDPLHARPSPDPPRSTRTAPGRGACFYSAYIAKERAAREKCLKVNVCIPRAFATSLTLSQSHTREALPMGLDGTVAR